MSSPFGSMSIALRSLLAQQGAMGTVANNIANVNTPGYSRQRPVLREQPPILFGRLLLGDGVGLEKVESIRDKILELRIHQETQQQGRLEALLGGLSQVEALFNETEGAGLEKVLSEFFNAFQALSVDPTSLPLRQAVLTAAGNLAGAFRRSVHNLRTTQNALNLSVEQTVEEINRLATQIAELNRQIAPLESSGQGGGVLEDQRTRAIRELSRLIDVAVIDNSDGSLIITSTRGVPLVAGVVAMSLEVRLDPTTGMYRIASQHNDVTSALAAGKLAGLIEARDMAIPSIIADLDNLAAGLITAVNNVHRTGYDLTGAAGGDFFVPFVAPEPGSNAGAAASLALALSDPAQVAASSDGTPGSNGVAVALAALRNQAVIDGQSIADFYSNTVFRLGDMMASASTELEAEGLVLRQLENQRAGVSAVSLDEEAAYLIRYQRAFEAAARVIATIDELTATVLTMVGRI